jgi:hypothetical protein
MSGLHRCPGRLTLERCLLGELERDRTREIEECPACAAVLEELRADGLAFALRPVPPALRERWTAPVRPRLSWPRLAALAAPLVAAAAVALVVAIPSGGTGPAGRDEGVPGIGGRADPGTLRTKGAGTADAGDPDLALGFYLLGPGGEPVLGRPGQALREGDRIQFWYSGARAEADDAAVLVGIDGREDRGEEQHPGNGGHVGTYSLTIQTVA